MADKKSTMQASIFSSSTFPIHFHCSELYDLTSYSLWATENDITRNGWEDSSFCLSWNSHFRAK